MCNVFKQSKRSYIRIKQLLILNCKGVIYMYNYIHQWPADREMGWSEELQGVCHDANNWFFTQNGNLWKFPITHRIADTCKSANVSKGIYKVSTSLHMGDIDHYNGLGGLMTTEGGPTVNMFIPDGRRKALSSFIEHLLQLESHL